MRSDRLSRRLNRNIALLIATSASALMAELSVPKPSGGGAPDVMWSVLAGVVSGAVVLSAITALRPKMGDIPRAAIAVAVSTLLFWMKLPGPFAAETVLACLILLALGIYGWVKRPRGKRRWRTRTKRRVRIAAAVVAAGFAFGVYLSLKAASDMRGIVLRASDLAAQGANDFQLFELDRGANKVRQASDILAEFDAVAGSLGGRFMSLVPVIGHQRAYSLDVIKQVRELGSRADYLARSFPQERLALRTGRADLTTIEQLDKPLSDMVYISEELTKTIRSSSPWLIHRFTGDIEALATASEKFHGTLKSTLDFVRVVPWLMGQDAPRTYVVNVMSPSESSPAGGMPVMTGRLVANRGDVSLTFSKKFDPDGAAAAALTNGADFPRAAESAWQVYSRYSANSVAGIITLDLKSVAQLATVTGPLPVVIDGTSTVIDPGGMLKVLEDETRAATVVTALTKRVLEIDPVQWRPFVALWGPMVDNGNIRLWLTDYTAAELGRAMKSDGAIGDATSIADVGVFVASAPGQKRAKNLGDSLRRSITHELTVADNGTVSATTRIALSNGAKTKNPLILTVFSPLECSATQDGASTVMTSGRQGVWVVHTVYATVDASSTATVVLSCTGSLQQQGLAVGQPRIHGQLVVVADDWKVAVASPEGNFAFAGPLNSNRWHEVPAK